MTRGSGQAVTPEWQAALERAAEVSARVLAPRAEATDRAALLPRENLRALREAGLLGLTVPKPFGGLEAPDPIVRRCLETVAAGCGVTAFVLFQHLGACRHLAGSENAPLREEVLPGFATGERFGALAFSHLRRPGPPRMRVEEDAEGFVYDGSAPWVTGWGLATDLVLAGTRPDGCSGWVLVPAAEGRQLAASSPLALCAMNASGTVVLTCRGLRVPRERWLKTVTPEQFARNSYGSVLFLTALSLGVTRSAAALLRRIGEERRNPRLPEIAAGLEAEVEAARGEADRVSEQSREPQYPARAVSIRARCIELGGRAAHLAVTASSGGANRLDHPAQRLLREAMVYTLAAQTPELREATLDVLSDTRR